MQKIRYTAKNVQLRYDNIQKNDFMGKENLSCIVKSTWNGFMKLYL